MNILILAKDSHVGGLLNFTCNLASGLSLKKNTNVVIGISPSDAIEPLRPFNLHEINFETKSPVEIIRNYFRIVNIVKSYNIDIIQAHNRLTALYAWIYCFFHKKTKYLWASLLCPIPSSFIHRITTKIGYCATASGSDDAKFLEEALRIPKEKIKLIYMGIDMSHCIKISHIEQANLKKKLGILDDEKVLLLYGRLDTIKGHKYMLDSLHLLKNANYKVIFPGENPAYKDQLMKVIGEYNLEDKILFPGYIDGREYLSITDLMVLPSKSDGISLAFLESISMGVPVIRTKTSGYNDVKDLCFGVDYGDTKGLSELIDAFLDGDDKYSSRAAIAKRESHNYSVENMVDSYYNLYCSAIKD